MSKRKILNYQQKCFEEYISSAGLPDDYRYPDGNKIRPIPPLKTSRGGLMIIGAYPSARFEQRRSFNNPRKFRVVPIADNLQPFGREEYFDGIKPRVLVSAEGLAKYLLAPLSLRLEDCWTTNLVKVFLYKESHIDSCKDSIHCFNREETRSRFKEYAKKSLKWIKEECQICQPKLVITLGQEVAQVISGHMSWSATKIMSLEPDTPESIGFIKTIYSPHPYACRRYEKWRNHLLKQIEIIKSMLA